MRTRRERKTKTMAQGKVTDFFSAKKRSASAHPSKRRKVEINASESQLDIANANEHRNLLDVFENGGDQAADNKTENVFSPLQTRAGRKAKSTKVATPKSVTRTRKTKIDGKQKLIADAFTNATKDAMPNLQIVDSVTSSWDDHDGAPSTPQKEIETLPKSRKRTRDVKTAMKEADQQSNEVTPEKRKPEKVQNKTETKAKKKLQLKSQQKEDVKVNVPEVDPKISLKVPDLAESSKAIAPSPKVSANVNAALKKCKAIKEKSEVKSIPKVTPEDIKAKLAKTGKLEDLKAQLSKIKETSAKVKTKKTEAAQKQKPALKKFDKLDIEVPSETKATVPAYERFHHLATPSAPTLNLPYKYKLLAEQFRGMDTVVSMLHNRNENCTFSKLKAAVQELTKRNFEQKHIGQIKTVYPTAYELRQEKGLSSIQGFKDPKYQMTVTANLNEPDETVAAKGIKSNFKASHLLNRRNKFHNGLIHIVKQHHKEFLSKLTKPLTIPDDKITRWHPKFPLDEVPDVETAPLPQPPDMKVLQSAKDVLEKTRGKVMPQVQAALESAAKEEKASSPSTTSSPSTNKNTTPAAAAPPKGFQSLLERIRAKEAAKTAEAMTRTPKEEKRIVMMKRLPNIMRIVRAQFVTEKKPALPLEMVIQKVLDSYKSCIAPGDIEPHIDLCRELLPEWISMVQIKKGKYLKIDKNLDLQTLTDKVENIAKTSKQVS